MRPVRFLAQIIPKCFHVKHFGAIGLADGTSAVWQYDQGANGVGHLSKITDVTGSISYSYDANGQCDAENSDRRCGDALDDLWL
jgi:hypothetical protein